TKTAAATRREFDVNVFGYLEMIRAVLPHMRARGGGIIHSVGSPTGDIGHSGLSGYAATKGAIKGLTRSLQMELQGTGVSCTLMLPPTTDTRMVADLGYPEWMLASPETVGRKLAGKIDSTDPVITPDRRTAFGLYLFERIPWLWQTITERYVDAPE
ncbi:MAG: SDR family NAD(P)-dependent oxidoreductase, partial [Halapricum sp.]